MNVKPRIPIPKRGVDYRGKVVLAPMVRSGELPSRLLALKYGADLVWGSHLPPSTNIHCVLVIPFTEKAYALQGLKLLIARS